MTCRATIEHAPRMTPWGENEGETYAAPGVVIVRTPSHGGVWLSPARRAQLPAAIRAGVGRYIASVWRASPGEWSEEDCEGPLVLACFASELNAEAVNVAAIRRAALDVAGAYYPELLPALREALGASS